METDGLADGDGEAEGLALLDSDLDALPDGLADLDSEADGLADFDGEATAPITAVQIAESLVPVFLYTFPPVLSRS